MSDYRDVVRTAIEKGFYLDSCGTDERHYTWGSWIDLCGMSVEDALKAADYGGNGGGGSEEGGDSGKTKNTITLSMQKGGDDEYSLYLSAAKAPTSDVTVYFQFDGVTQSVVLPAGVTSVNSGLKGEDPSKPYATIDNINISSDDEKYTYTPKNSVKNGIFKATIINDGKETVEQVKYGTPLSLDTPEEKPGYEFVWSVNGEKIEEPESYVMPESDVTVIGEYVPNKHIITYNIYKEKYDGGIVVETVSSATIENVEFNSKIYPKLPVISAENGYTLNEWSVDGEEITSDYTMPDKDIEVSATYKLNEYSLKYVGMNDAVVSEKTYYFTQGTDNAPEVPAETGYESKGWDKETPASMPAENLVITAVYEKITYYVRYNVLVEDGEAITYEEPHYYGDEISIRADETMEGYTFSGWNPSALPATMPAEDIAVNGELVKNTYKLTIMVDGEVFFTKEYKYGDAIDKEEIPQPEKEGYTFTGWEPEIPDTVPSNDLEISAKFQINQYAVRYYVDDAEYASFTYGYGTEIVAIEEPEKEGYTFSGWGDYPATVPAHDVEIRGIFSINSYLLSYYVDGELVESAETEYNTEIESREYPVKEGYTFSGWDGEPERMPAHDVEVRGEFTVNVHNIVYRVDGEEYQVITGVAYGTEIVAIEEPEKEGYTFGGWQNVPATMPDEDVVIDGEFTINQYTLSFILDGEPYTSITGDFGAEIEAPVPEKVGYTFSGWNPEVPATIPSQDMAFEGSMNINSWVATYKIDGNVYSSVTYEYGAEIVYPDVPKEGYDLIWNKEFVTMPDNDIVIEGEYAEHPVPKAVYYGAVLNDIKSEWTDVSEMDAYEYADGEETADAFVLTGIPEYLIIEEQYNNGEISDEEFDAWCNEHSRVPFFSIPATAELVKVKNATNVDVTAIVRPAQAITVGADEYQCYYIDSVIPPIGTDDTLIYKITIQTK